MLTCEDLVAIFEANKNRSMNNKSDDQGAISHMAGCVLSMRVVLIAMYWKCSNRSFVFMYIYLLIGIYEQLCLTDKIYTDT
jgi:hypothetical protein